MRYDRLKPSQHHLKNQTRPGHAISNDLIDAVVRTPRDQTTQEDGREVYWGTAPAYLYPVRVVVSAAVSAGKSIGAS